MGEQVVNCFQIRNFVTSNNFDLSRPEQGAVVNCFQIRNFVTSNNFSLAGRRAGLL